VVSQTSI